MRKELAKLSLMSKVFFKSRRTITICQLCAKLRFLGEIKEQNQKIIPLYYFKPSSIITTLRMFTFMPQRRSLELRIKHKCGAFSLR
jgi:hypothetical protein